ncbi:MAG: S41 family peptidase [Bacteroidales bacterium]|jgi:carboxyl-terminal processing protease|nr:S41 family peptidase [Bacteroidales bacterium]
MKRKLFLRIYALALCAILISPLRAQHDFEIAKNVDIFISVMKELNSKYAEDISPTALTKTAIDAMLQSLDPYTVYFPESQIEDFRIMTTGQYGGIGSTIQPHGDKVVISELFEDSPAAEAGLMAGDIIMKINNQATAGKTSDDVSTILKGEPGSTITIEIERPTTGEKKTFQVARKEIKLPNIPYYGIIGDNTGYIKLDQFTENAGSEVTTAFKELKKNGMQYLILDLRNNGGGLLHEAVNIMNIFVDQGVPIASTKGKIPEQTNTFRTRNPVIDKNIPVVVLVNENSASASEIVSGAFQDLDRGVVVGKKTYGKGLVQNIIPLSYNTSLKITVSKYYIPSGRCVQNIDYFTKDTLTQSVEIPDSLATPYKTKNGRIVYDKGGVEPDVKTEELIPSNILVSLVINNLIFDFANQYHAKHTTIADPQNFVITDELYDEFLHFLKDKEYDYTSQSEYILKELEEMAKEEKYFDVVEPLYNEILKKIDAEKENELLKFKSEISEFLSSEIVVRYYFNKGRIINMLSFDTDILEARKILHDSARYKKILSGKK